MSNACKKPSRVLELGNLSVTEYRWFHDGAFISQSFKYLAPAIAQRVTYSENISIDSQDRVPPAEYYLIISVSLPLTPDQWHLKS